MIRLTKGALSALQNMVNEAEAGGFICLIEGDIGGQEYGREREYSKRARDYARAVAWVQELAAKREK